MRYAFNLENLVKSSRTKVTSILLCTFLSILLSYAYYCFGSMIEFSVGMGSSSLSHVVLVPVFYAKNESTFGLYRRTQGACWSYHARSYWASNIKTLCHDKTWNHTLVDHDMLLLLDYLRTMAFLRKWYESFSV